MYIKVKLNTRQVTTMTQGHIKLTLMVFEKIHSFNENSAIFLKTAIKNNVYRSQTSQDLELKFLGYIVEMYIRPKLNTRQVTAITPSQRRILGKE